MFEVKLVEIANIGAAGDGTLFLVSPIFDSTLSVR
jgi:hypothetical protein